MAQPRFLRAIYPAFSARYMRARTDADRRARDTGVRTTRQDPGLRAVSELWRSFASSEHDLRAQAPAIAAPMLLIWGKHDPVIPVKVGRGIAATIPAAKLVVLDSGHVPHTTDPQAFADALIPFAQHAFAPRKHNSAQDHAAGGPVSDQRLV